MLGLNNTMTELKNSKESLNFRLDQAKEIISELEDLKLSNQRIKMKKRMKKHEESLQELQVLPPKQYSHYGNPRRKGE